MSLRNIFLLLAVTVAFCSNAQVSDDVVRRTVDTVYLITPNDDFDANADKLGDFKVKADFNTSWTKNKQRIEEHAREAGANVALIKFIGWEKHNHGFYASGALYHADSAQIQKLCASIPQDDNCSIVLFRDNGPSLATFYFDVTINGDAFPHFSEMTFIRKHLDTCEAPVRVTIKRFVHNLPPQEHTRYFRIITDNGSPLIGNGLAVRFNGPVLQEIEDRQLGNLLMRRLKPFQPDH